jgi:methyl-accepting chemotaxis protein
MKNLKIGTKLFVSPLTAIVFLLVLGIFANNALNSNKNTLDTLVNEKFELYKQNAKLMTDLNLYNGILYKIFNFATGGYKQKIIDDEIVNLQNLQKDIDNEIQKLSNLSFLDNKEKDLFAQFSKELTVYKNAVKDAINMISIDIGMATPMLGVTEENFLKINQILKDINKDIIENNKISYEDAINKINTTQYTLYVLFFIALILSGLIAFIASRAITHPLSSIQQGLNSFFRFLNRETDRADPINLDSKDEFGQMAKAINTNISAIEKGLLADANAVANSVEVANKIKAGYLNEQITVIPNNPQLVELRNVLNEMLQTLSSKVSYDLNELELVFKAYIASDFTARVKNPKGQVDIITNNLGDEIGAMLSNSLQNGIDLQGEASTLKQAVESLSTASNQQAASLEETAAAMEEMTSNVQNNVAKSNDMALMATQTDSAAREGAVLAQRTASAMTEIQSATNSINDAVAIIENIAFQTNILSLNAAVEAATAGDAGKGFAVVAQEVRNLANRSADAAKEIKAMASQAANKSNEGMNIATELTRGFEVIADKIAQTASMVQDVSNANREQMQGIGQINTAVTQLDQMTQENAKVAAQADAIANATISKAEAMVQDALSKEFVGKSNIRATQSSTTGINATRTSKPVQAAKPVVAKQKYASNAIAKNSSKHESDVWESF